MWLWLIFTGALCLLLGIVLTLIVQRRMPLYDADKLLAKLNSTVDCPLMDDRQPVAVQLPEGMADNLAANTRTIGGDDTLLAINLLIQFFFRQFHSDGYVRQLLIRRVNKEMQEGVQKAGAAVNKIIKGLKIYDIEMGSKAPAIKSIDVNSVVLDRDGQLIDSVDVGVHLDYAGGFAIGIDVALAYDKTAFLSAKVDQLEGILRLKFARKPYSHWTAAFCPPPTMQVAISSRIQGQSYGVVTDLLASLVENWIQSQHCLPYSKMMTHPLFPDLDHSLTRPSPTSVRSVRAGRLQVNVCDISRLDLSLFQADGLFCIVGLDSCPWIDFAPSEQVGHVLLEIRLIRKRDRPLGFVFHGLPSGSSDYSQIDEIVADLVGAHPAGVVVINTEPGSAADEAGFRPGDVILEVDGVAVNSIRQVLRTVADATAKYVTIRVDRFIPAVKSKIEKSHVSRGDEPLYPLPDDLDASHRETIGRMVGLEMKRTKTHPLSQTVQLGDTMEFRILPSQRFLNLTVWLTGVKSDSLDSTHNTAAGVLNAGRPKFSLSRLFKMKEDIPPESASAQMEDEALKEGRIGYVNVSLSELAAACHLNTHGHHVSTYQLYPADAKASLGRKHPLNDQAGFDPRLCYGDVTLSFVYQPDEDIQQPEPLDSLSEELSGNTEGAERDRSQADVVIYELKRPHDWTLKRFGQLESCNVCQSKIWLGEGLHCPRCALIIHKKCFKRIVGENRKWCSVNQSIAKIDDYYISNVPIPVEGIKSDLEGNPFQVDEDNDERAEIDSVVERLQARDHNESLVRLAKDSGRKLFHQLTDVEKRRNKISSMLNIIDDAVRAETIRRYELAAEWERSTANDAGAGHSRWIEVELAASERKRQALVLLQLYFSAGWQDVEDSLG